MNAMSPPTRAHVTMPTLPELPSDLTQDLSDRWRRARRSALHRVVPEAALDVPEAELVPLAMVRDLPETERAVFEVSLALGTSFCRWSRTDLTLTDLARLLPAIGAPCSAMGFARVGDELASRSERPACDTPGACTYWREALHGLVSGLSSSVRYSRVSSGPQAGVCVDLLHVDAQSPHRLAPIPDEIRPTLEQIAEKVLRVVPGARVQWLGLREGALCFEAHQPSSGCTLDIQPLILSSLRRALPDLPIQNATPRPVITDQA